MEAEEYLNEHESEPPYCTITELGKAELHRHFCKHGFRQEDSDVSRDEVRLHYRALLSVHGFHEASWYVT